MKADIVFGWAICALFVLTLILAAGAFTYYSHENARLRAENEELRRLPRPDSFLKDDLFSPIFNVSIGEKIFGCI